jgi:hypothetical protein
MPCFSFLAGVEAETKLLSIGERFPNLKTIIWDNESEFDETTRKFIYRYNTIFELAKQLPCPNLELVQGTSCKSKHKILFCDEIKSSTEWKNEILSRFPNYCAINVSNLSRNNTKEQILADIQNTKITHAVFTKRIKDANTEQVAAIFDFILPTLTHLIVNLPDGTHNTERTSFWQLILERIENFSGELKLVYFCDNSGGYDSDKLFSRTPHLLEVGASVADIDALTKHCSKLTKLTCSRYDSKKVLFEQLPNLKTFEFTYSPSVAQYMEEVRAYTNEWVPSKEYPNLKRLFIGIGKKHVDKLIKHVPNLEEISVKNILKVDVMKLVNGLPKLRFIHNFKSTITAPRLRNDIVDVCRWREILAEEKKDERPTKKRRTKK